MRRPIVVFFIIIIALLIIISPPDGFSGSKSIYIGEGQSLRSVSKTLKDENIIRSRVAFETFVILFGKEKSVLPGDYLFTRPMAVFEVASIFAGGARNLKSIKVTIPEGFDSYDIAQVAKAKLQSFNESSFLVKANEHEGKLFPDTYFFFSTDTEDTVLKTMTENYEKKIKPLRAEIESSGRTEGQILIMASILEREAKGVEDSEMISGILWKRLSIGMALQADAAPETYDHAGLPVRPIGNPGILAIKAAINPKTSSYLYYIHDKRGNIYYAKTFDEHRQNIKKYLK